MVRAKKEKVAAKKKSTGVKPKKAVVKKVSAKPTKHKAAPHPKVKVKAKARITVQEHLAALKLKAESAAPRVIPAPVPPVIPKVIPKPEPPKVILKPEHKPEVKAKVEIHPKAKVEEKPKPKVEVKVEHKPEAKVEEAPRVEVKAEPLVDLKELLLELPITVKDLAIKLQEKPSIVIKSLMDSGIMAGINQSLDEATASKICAKYKYRIKQAPGQEELTLKVHEVKDSKRDLLPRAPVVTIMGHVDHGKTSLLDAIRKTKVAESEHGGITQHIGAYRVKLAHGEITFLDTPGHEAFTAMRARGASITDIVVLVVAADDGIMPQTEESIDHARAAGVPIIVAVNKIDKTQADLDRVKKQLTELDLKAEDWGGKTITVPVSAKTGQGIDQLLEMILLEAQMQELKANPNRLARGVVIEAKMSKGRGPVVTLLIQNGTLRLNENIVVGTYFGKIRAMFNDHGHSVTEAKPSFPVEVLGLSGIPAAGEPFFALEDEKEAKELAALRMEKERQQQVKVVKRISLEDLHIQITEGKIKELKIILKADMQGSLGAIKETLNKLNVSEIKLDIIHSGVGNINSSDVILAIASNALILGFNVVADDLAKEQAAKEGVETRTYNIIYELANDIKAAVEGMLEPQIKKVFLGRAEIRKVMKLSRAGIVAGCFVSKGKINRHSLINLTRNGAVVFEGKLSSLKRFKDDVREVAEGFECGMTIAGFDQVLEGDIIEAYDIEKIARKL
jgi:translation initiation factor IF-2